MSCKHFLWMCFVEACMCFLNYRICVFGKYLPMFYVETCVCFLNDYKCVFCIGFYVFLKGYMCVVVEAACAL